MQSKELKWALVMTSTLLISVGGCSATKSGSSVPESGITSNQKRSDNSAQAERMTSSTGQEALPVARPLRDNITGPAPVLFGDNSSKPDSAMLGRNVILAAQHLDFASRSVFQVTSVDLKHWSEVDQVRSGFWLAAVDKNRRVYSIRTSFRTPVMTKGGLYSSGVTEVVVDAETGKPFYDSTGGNIVKSARDYHMEAASANSGNGWTFSDSRYPTR